jgi:GH15 family glucan-1,4-alpha-glucosidase
MPKTIEPVDLQRLYQSSLEIIRANQVANFRVYDYSWFRDGSFIANAMVLAGDLVSARKFHQWAAVIIVDRAPRITQLLAKNRAGAAIELNEHLECRYTADGEEGSEPWTNFQLDGFGSWLWSLKNFAASGAQISEQMMEASQIITPYLCEFWSLDSYDWWEENFGHQHVSTLGSIGAGLLSFCEMPWANAALKARAAEQCVIIKEIIQENGTQEGRLTKWIEGDGLDSSLLSLFSPFNFFESRSSIGQNTIAAISTQLGVGGTYRHKEDSYFGGGRWPLLSCFLALAFIDLGDLDQATYILNWVASTSNLNMELPEQVDGDLLFPEVRQEWISRWGEPAIPLLWSHAMFIHLYVKLVEAGVQL